jgi:hypothetical protein
MSEQKNEQIMIGRAKNALLSFFEQRLSVPKIYLDADWEGQKVDVLAIDRAGVGDVSVALIRHPDANPRDIIQKLHSFPAHFKYWVGVHDFGKPTEESRTLKQRFQSASMQRVEHSQLANDPALFAEDGVGRIGQIVVDLSGGRSIVTMTISAERFRSNQHIYDLADAFASGHTADFEVRP